MCAFGAGAAHVALLALVLPVMITLPTPADKAQGTVAIQVVVRSAPPPTLDAAMAQTAALPPPEFIGGGDVDEDALPASALNVLPASAEITGSLPQVSESSDVLQTHAALSETVVPAPPSRTVEPVALPLIRNVPAPDVDARVDGEAVASIESREAPEALLTIVPLPLRKPAVSAIVAPAPPAARKPVRKARVKPRPRVATPNRAQAAPSANKGFLGGRQAVPMPEYSFANR